MRISLFENISIKKKIIAISFFTSGAAVLMVSIAFIINDVFWLRSNTIQNLSSLSDIIEHNVQSALTFNDADSAMKDLSALSAEPSVVTGVIYDRHGMEFALYGKPMPVEMEPQRSGEDHVHFEHGYFHLQKPIFLDGEHIGELQILYDTRVLRETIYKRILFCLLFLALALLMGYWLSSGLQRVVSEPILQLATVAEDVSKKKDYSIRAAKRGKDEIGDLIDDFNGMLGQIQKRDLELTEIHANLEKRILERTAELEAVQAQMVQSAKMAAVGQLAGGIAHDFNNLLTVINGYAMLIYETLPDKDPMRADVEEIQKSGKRAAELVSKLLVFSRRNVVQMKVVNLNDLIVGMSAMLRRFVPESVEYSTLPAADLENVKIDVSSFEQVLVNLVVNAVQAMSNGGKLIVETKNILSDADYQHQHPQIPPGEYILLTVSDTGTGMSEEAKSHAFEPFFTTKEKGKGTGLGLATSYSVVTQHQGYIEIQSELGKGTTFGIYLPCVHEKAIGYYDKEKEANLPRGTGKILVVEDEPAVRSFAVRILNTQGYTTLEASNGEEALRLLEKEKPGSVRLVLTDVIMPQMGGKELNQKLKVLFPDLGVVFMSGYAEDLIADTEGRTFLHKPFTPRALAFVIQESLA